MGKQAVVIGGNAKAKNFDFEMIWDTPDVEIWGINAIRKKWVPRWDRMFNIHRYELLKKYAWPVNIDAEWAADHPQIPFYVADAWPDKRMSKAIIFPREEMADMPRHDYHVNSFDWLIALAVLWEYDAIHIHGAMLATDGIMEQMSSRACFEYWAGYAEGKGVKVYTSKDCDLFYAYHIVRSERLYGYDDCPAWEDRTKDGKDPPYSYED